VVRFLVWAIAAAFRPRVRLIAENLCLRQQLLVLQRRHPQPRLGNADRRFWIIASRWFSSWRGSLLIVKPETVLRWHRQGWRAYWSWRSRRPRGRSGRRPIPQELQALIRRMTAENRLWGQKRIQAELARLGFYSFCEDRRKIYEFATRSRAVLGLAKILEAPRIEHMGVRFLLRPNNPFSDALCLFCNPAREPGNLARCDNAVSDSRVGSPANSGVLRLGSIATAVPDSRP
jgi:hypothetical protein